MSVTDEKKLTTYLLSRLLSPNALQRHADYIRGKSVFVPYMKYAQVLYLLFLEYASRCPEYKIPTASPMHNLTFFNSMRGPFAYQAFMSSREVYSNIASGRVPSFSELNFTAGESERLSETLSVVKQEISTLSSDHINWVLSSSYRLPLNHRFPLVASHVEMTPANVVDEVRAYNKHRKELIGCKKHQK